MTAFAMHEDDVTEALASPDIMINTDGVPASLGGLPHPRLYGTFPRVLGLYVRERAVLPLDEAVRRMTSLAAKTFRIPERGLIKPGYIADLVAFDATTVIDTGDYTDPTRSPDGISWVMQQGHIVVEDNTFLGTRRGQRLLPARRS